MKSIVICGSRRFKQEVKKFAAGLRKLGVDVYAPHHHSGQDRWGVELPEEYQQFVALGVTHDHFHKIRMADTVFVYNKGGYSGPSTTLEVGFAVALGKPIYALAPDDELCRHVLFREVIGSPKRLAECLR